MRTTTLLIAALAVGACKKDSKPEAAPEAAEETAPAEAPADETPATTDDEVESEDLTEVPAAADVVVVTEDPTTGRLTLSADAVGVGEPVTVAFVKTGLNGCYTQTDVETTTEGMAWTHSYTTAHEGEVCTANIPMGGFSIVVTPDKPGAWTGSVVVDGETAATYQIAVATPGVAGDAEASETEAK